MAKAATNGGERTGTAASKPALSEAVLSIETDPAGTCQELTEARKELAVLNAALDHVQSGLMILDSELYIVYSNPATRRMFKVANSDGRQRRFYGDSLRAAADASAVDLDDYVARRLAWVASGNPDASDLNMSDGTVLRCQLAPLPGGGRMLIYSDVTDIVRAGQAMEKLATTDGMTGIYNRRHFMTLADREWDRARRYRRTLSLLMIDIDFFKAINDRFGHEAGDRAIVQVANLASGCKRSSDILARIGGEEFALLLPETEIDQAEALAERLRGEISRNPLTEWAHPTTVSIGLASVDASMQGVSDLMKLADQALYAAKNGGRNRVMRGGTAAPFLASA